MPQDLPYPLPCVTTGLMSREDQLIAQYAQIHATKHYGASSEILIGIIQRHIYDLPQVARIIDYGCGRSRLVDWLAKIHDAEAVRYDPAIPEFADRPDAGGDLVICTDVMEHIPVENVQTVLEDIQSLAPHAYFNISCREAHEILPNGENAHCTVRPHAWWMARISNLWPEARRTRAMSKDDVGLVTWGA